MFVESLCPRLRVLYPKSCQPLTCADPSRGLVRPPGARSPFLAALGCVPGEVELIRCAFSPDVTGTQAVVHVAEPEAVGLVLSQVTTDALPGAISSSRPSHGACVSVLGSAFSVLSKTFFLLLYHHVGKVSGVRRELLWPRAPGAGAWGTNYCVRIAQKVDHVREVSGRVVTDEHFVVVGM